MPFDEIIPRKGAGPASTFSKQIRCGIYVCKNNIRLSTVIGGDIASFVGIARGHDVSVEFGNGTDLGIIKIYKSPKDGRAHYKAQLNGKNEDRKDIRVVITIPPYLSDHLSSEQTNLLLCQRMVKDKVIIVNLHKDLHRGPIQGELDLDPDGLIGF